MFPFSASGTVYVGHNDAREEGAILSDVAHQIRLQKPSILEVREDHIYFEAGLVRPVLSNNPLVSITRGTVRVSRTALGMIISYRLSFVQIIVVAAVLSLMLTILPPVRGEHSVGVFIGAWLFLVLGNYGIGIAQFRSLLKRVVSCPVASPPSETELIAFRKLRNLRAGFVASLAASLISYAIGCIAFPTIPSVFAATVLPVWAVSAYLAVRLKSFRCPRCQRKFPMSLVQRCPHCGVPVSRARSRMA